MATQEGPSEAEKGRMWKEAEAAAAPKRMWKEAEAAAVPKKEPRKRVEADAMSGETAKYSGYLICIF